MSCSCYVHVVVHIDLHCHLLGSTSVGIYPQLCHADCCSGLVSPPIALTSVCGTLAAAPVGMETGDGGLWVRHSPP